MLATEVHRRLISDCNERDPRSGAVPPLRRFGLALVPRLPVLDGFPAAMLRFAPPCAGADCVDPPPGIDPPGFWAVLKENGSDFDALPGVLGGYSVPRRDSCRWLRYSPRSEAFTSSVPCSAACETAQNLARALCRTSDRAKNGVMGLRNRPELCSCVRPRALDEHRVARETTQNSARALPEHV